MAERIASFARWRVLSVDCADERIGPVAFCPNPAPDVREPHPETRAYAW